MRTLPTASLTLHPQAKLVPEMPPDQYKRFLADVKARGVLEPIELIPGTRMVIEGRTRLKAATEAGLPGVPVVDADLRDDSPVLYMLRSALLRRQLTKGQAAALAVEIEAQLAKEAKQRQREGASRGGRSKDKDAAIVPQPSTAKKDHSGRAREQAAAAAGVGARYVSDAKKVKAQDPELFEQVKAGKVTLPEATRAVKSEPKPKPVIDTGELRESLPAKSQPPTYKPCPFCGSTELILALEVVCYQCGALGPKFVKGDADAIRDSWNRRAGK